MGYDEAAVNDPLVAAIARGTMDQAPVLTWRMHPNDNLAVWSHYFRTVVQLVVPQNQGRQAQAVDCRRHLLAHPQPLGRQKGPPHRAGGGAEQYHHAQRPQAARATHAQDAQRFALILPSICPPSPTYPPTRRAHMGGKGGGCHDRHLKGRLQLQDQTAFNMRQHSVQQRNCSSTCTETWRGHCLRCAQ